jgi:hypothetical protein
MFMSTLKNNNDRVSSLNKSHERGIGLLIRERGRYEEMNGRKGWRALPNDDTSISLH